MKFVYTFGFILCWTALASGQSPVTTLSDSAQLSLMTVAPGNAVYSIFGHSAIRVYDPLNRVDRCYNYGTFDFEQPNFVLKFCRGKLLYSLDVESYRNFEYGNIYDRRPMKEQVFNFTPQQKQRLFDLLRENALPQNKDYKYDFFYDNCATRVRDIVKETFYHQLFFDSTKLQRGLTMRQLLHPYLKESPWLGFGIDLVLGYPADRVAQPEDFMFLPDHMHHMMATTLIDDSTRLVASERAIPQFPLVQPEWKPGLLGRPFWVMLFVAVIGLLSMANPRTEHIFDTVFWFVLGVAGLIIALLWFATDHTATKTNLNLFWALPTHLLYFWRRTRSEWVENYFTGTAIVAALMLIFWAFLPQHLPVAAIPIVSLVVVKGLWRRYWKTSKLDDV